MLYDIKGSVIKLFISVKGKDDRVEKKLIDVDKDGVQSDKFYAKNPQRSILITSKSSYELAKENGINIQYGSLGENIVLDTDIYHLEVGDKIHIGSTVLQITQNCTICNSLSKIDKSLPELLATSRGIFARVLTGSSIKVSDKVSLEFLTQAA